MCDGTMLKICISLVCGISSEIGYHELYHSCFGVTKQTFVAKHVIFNLQALNPDKNGITIFKCIIWRGILSILWLKILSYGSADVLL